MIYSTLETRHPAGQCIISLGRIARSLSAAFPPTSLSLSLPLASLLPELFLLFFSSIFFLSFFLLFSFSFLPPFATIATLTSCLLRETRQREGVGWRERERADEENDRARNVVGIEMEREELEWGRIPAYTNASMPLTHQPHPVFWPSGLSVTFVETPLASFRSFITR